MMFSIKVHDTRKGRVVAACDEEVLGELYEEGKVRLEVDEDFYGGRKAGLEEVLQELENYVTANLVGNRLVEALVEEEVVEEGEFEEVDAVKHAQLFRV